MIHLLTFIVHVGSNNYIRKTKITDAIKCYYFRNSIQFNFPNKEVKTILSQYITLSKKKSTYLISTHLFTCRF